MKEIRIDDSYMFDVESGTGEHLAEAIVAQYHCGNLELGKTLDVIFHVPCAKDYGVDQLDNHALLLRINATFIRKWIPLRVEELEIKPSDATRSVECALYLRGVTVSDLFTGSVE